MILSQTSNFHIFRTCYRSGYGDCATHHYELTLKETTKVMPTANIDISDRLINSQIGTANSQDICHSKRPKANNNIH